MAAHLLSKRTAFIELKPVFSRASALIIFLLVPQGK